MTNSNRPLAVITGASSGIGAKLASRLAREGYDLVLVARREEPMKDLLAKIIAETPATNGRVIPLDLEAAGSAEKLFAEVPHAKLVVNAAGFGKIAGVFDIDLETYRRMIALNVSTLTELTYLYGRRMAETGGGTIMNVASTAAFRSIPYFSIYSATKAYVVAMSEAVHEELRDRRVNVLAYCPGPTDTEFSSSAGMLASQVSKGRFFIMAPDAVAADMVRAIRRRRQTGVPGLLNRLMACFQQIAPKFIVRRFTMIYFKPTA